VTSLKVVRAAVIERLTPVADVTYYTAMPTFPETPAVVATPDHPPAEFEQTFSLGYTRWNLMLTLIVDRVDEAAAQDQLSEWMDPAGPFIGALRADGVADTLGRLTEDVRVTAAADFQEMHFNRVRFYYAQLRVAVKA
jgi:hypothetical protein